MNGIHDMGGMHGFGPVQREAHGHAEWELRVIALNRLSQKQGYFNIDEFRYGIENMQPTHYLRSAYFERWLATVEYNLIEKGLLTRDELDSRTEQLRRQSETDRPEHTPAGHVPQTLRGLPETTSSSLEPRFAVGDKVLVRNSHPTWHTRVPRYVRGKRGVIHLVHGPSTFPDTHAHGLGKNPQNVYNVRFDGPELWRDSAEPGQILYIDLWESYLEPDPT